MSADKIFQQAEGRLSFTESGGEGAGRTAAPDRAGSGKAQRGNHFPGVPVLSPINGFVSKVNVNIGKYVTANGCFV